MRSNNKYKPSLVKQCLRVSALCLAIGIAGCDQIDSTGTVDNQEVLTRAQSYLDQGQYRAASIEIRNALQNNPKDIKAHLAMSELLLEVGEARAVIERLEKFPNSHSLDYVTKLTKAYMERYKYHSALQLLEKNANRLKDQFTYQLLLTQAHQGLNQWDKAKEALDRAIKLAQDNDAQKASIYVEEAKFALQKDDIDKANELLDKSLALQKDPRVLAYKGSLAFQSGRLDVAEDHLSQALLELKQSDIVTPLRAEILQGLVQILTKSGRSSEALIYSKILAEASPSSEELESNFGKAMELYQEGKLDEAEKLLADIHASNANELSGKMLGVINAQQGDLSEANRFMSESIDPETATNDLIRVYTETKLKLNQTEEALKLIEEKAKQKPNDPEILAIYGLTLMSAGKLEESQKVIEKTLKIAPDRSRLRIALSRLLSHKQDHKGAIKQLETAYKNSPEDPDVLVELSRVYLANREQDKARELGQQLLKNHSDKAFANALAGSVALANDDAKQAVDYYRQSLRLDKDNLSVEFGLAKAYIRTGKMDKGIAQIEQIMEKAPNSPAIYKGYITANVMNNSIAEAIKKLETKAENNIQLWAPYAVLAEYEISSNQLPAALKHIDKALQRNAVDAYPQNVATVAYNMAANRAYKAKRFDDGRNYIMKGLQLKPNNENFLAMLTSIEIGAGKQREARKLIKQLESSNPKSVFLPELNGDLALQEGKQQDAINFYQTAWRDQARDSLAKKLFDLKVKMKQPTTSLVNEWISRLPNSDMGYLVKAMNSQQAGRNRQAIQAYEKVLSINPYSLPGINNLAWLKQQLKHSDALELAERGAKLHADNAAMLDTYGWILLENGQPKKASKVLKKALTLAPDNQEIQEHLQQAESK